jgi:putative hydrolase of the HAD superfamily
MSARALTTIGFDADDTLWHHERFFQLTTARFVELLQPYAEPAHLSEHLHAAEKRNVLHYGYGVKGFVLSMVETAIDVTDGRVPGHVIGNILAAGRDMLEHPVEAFAGGEATLAALRESHQLVLITRGDLFDQERKLAASGLAPYFHAVEIVSDKTAPVYERIFTRHGAGASRAMMIGNSMRADVVPALAAGAWGIHVPSEHVWALDLHDDPVNSPRFRRFRSLLEVLPLVAEIG